ncbi:comt-3 [Pristionchus pacificus]|nr:comt-3 [Pristionchus pacificus]
MATDFASKIYNLKLELQPASIIEYTSEISTQSFTSLQKELLDATIAHARLPMMLGASEVHEMGKSMITLTRTKKVLDIGTFTGASALAWAIELPIDGKVISMDVDHTQLEKVGLPIINKASELRAKIEFRIGSAVDTLQSLIANGESGSFGFAFIDADKENYSSYYELCLQLLAPGGVIMVDNALWNGWVLEPTKADSMAIDKLNRLVSADSRVHNTLLNIDDGVHLIVKKY